MSSRLREFYSAVVERNATWDQGSCETEPYEAGWASEAIAFVRVMACQGEQPRLQLSVQISPDGLVWVDEGTVLPVIAREGVYFARVSHFGNWLRLAGTVDRGSFRVLVYWTLKS